MVLQRAAVLPSDFSFSFDLRWHGLPRISRVALFRPRLSTFANAPPSLLQLRSTGVPFLLPQVLSDFLRVYLRATMSTSSLTSNRIISLLFLLVKTLLIGKHFYNLSHRWIWPTDNRGIIANLFITHFTWFYYLCLNIWRPLGTIQLVLQKIVTIVDILSIIFDMIIRIW